MSASKKLPKSSLLNVQIGWYWFRNDYWRTTRWFMKTRGANFASVWLGPVCITWRMPWLEGPARQLHPEAFKESA